ncbi:glucomannan 4-beta-mannosyltransferase 9-like protein [Tanacetum coccineum]
MENQEQTDTTNNKDNNENERDGLLIIAWFNHESWFLDAGRRNNNHRKKTTTDTGTCSASGSDGILNDATPCVDAAMKDVSPYVVEETVAMECHMVNTPDVGLNLPLPIQEENALAGNAPGKPSYATATGKTSRKKVNVHTLYTPEGNGIDVVVLVDSICVVSERFANTAYGFFLGKKVAYPVVANYVRKTWGKYGLVRSMFSSSSGLFSVQFSSIDGLDAMLENVWVKLHGVPIMAFSEEGLNAIATKLGTPLMLDSDTSDMCIQSLGRSSYARVMIELRADVELKDNIVVAMPKITREGHYTCVGEKKTMKKPSQTSRGVSVGPKIGFKPQKEYRHVPIKPNVNSSGNKKKGVDPTIEVSNSNPFDVLNSVDNDVEFGTNGETTNLVNNRAISSGSSFMHVDNYGEFTSNTPIGEKIDKIERQICKGKLRLLDNDENPLVPTGIVKSDGEVEVIFDESTNLRISTSGKDESDKGYGTNSLLEQWRDSYPNDDDYDPSDDDMYENHNMSEHLQFIFDDLDITVYGRKKKYVF